MNNQTNHHVARRVAIGLAAVAVASVALPASGGAAAEGDVSTQMVDPGDTGPGITAEASTDDHHRVAAPVADRRDELVLYLGGSGSSPSHYDDITSHVAGLGFGVINLSYPNAVPIGVTCIASDACYTNSRGEITFGATAGYPGVPDYQALTQNVDVANSVIGRTVALLDHLAQSDAYWSQFLIPTPGSPYTGTHSGPALPDWSKIVISGHSQGGGHAAFVAMQVPVHRVVMLASPNDTVLTVSGASWISAASATPMERFWGIRHVNEGSLGSKVPERWDAMGGVGVGGAANGMEADIGNGSGDPLGRQRLVLTVETASQADNHSSMAADTKYLPGVPDAWDYVFTGGGGCA